MVKQNFLTIKELEEKLGERTKNIIISGVNSTIEHLEKMEADEKVAMDGLKIHEVYKKRRASDRDNTYDIYVRRNKIYLYKNSEDAGGCPSIKNFSCVLEDERELLSKAVILNLILKELDRNNINVSGLLMEDVLNEENKTKLECKIELASRLLIPKSLFNATLGRDILRIIYVQRSKDEQEFVTPEVEMDFLFAKLRSYGVNDKMAMARLKTAYFEGSFTIEDFEDLDYWIGLYCDQKEKPSIKKMNNNN